MRGEQPIQAAAIEAQKAATRNGWKGDYHRTPIFKLFEMLREEIDEFEAAVLTGNAQRICEEGGDCWWVIAMIADHGGHLCGFPDECSVRTGALKLKGEV